MRGLCPLLAINCFLIGLVSPLVTFLVAKKLPKNHIRRKCPPYVSSSGEPNSAAHQVSRPRTAARKEGEVIIKIINSLLALLSEPDRAKL